VAPAAGLKVALALTGGLSSAVRHLGAMGAVTLVTTQITGQAVRLVTARHGATRLHRRPQPFRLHRQRPTRQHRRSKPSSPKTEAGLQSPGPEAMGGVAEPLPEAKTATAFTVAVFHGERLVAAAPGRVIRAWLARH
jgi:hypothetical protein